MLVGFWAAGQISEMYTTVDGHDWSTIWIIPAGFSAAVLVLFLLTFKNETITYEEE
ncbi:MAG: hypothetical protein AAGC88_08955 [Bacteroidota bacterium]